jgi:serine/threonine protein kinase
MDAELQNIGPYRLLKPLGRGGMGVVYRAVHQHDGHLVALKTVRLAAQSQLAGLRREIHALARLRHPGIVRILDKGVANGLPWYAMELLEGRTLKSYAQRLGAAGKVVPAGTENKTTMPGSPEGEWRSGWWTWTLEDEVTAEALLQQAPGTPAPEATTSLRSAAPERLLPVLSLVRRLCAALAYLHGEGLVHRDLKLDNVLVTGSRVPQNAAHPTPDEQTHFVGAPRFPTSNPTSWVPPAPWPVLLDFGLATQFSGEVSREALAAVGFTAGTVSTMAPEQIRGELVDARADLYSLGCILYELVTGRPPFVDEAPVQVLWQHLNAEPEAPSKLVGDVPEGLEELILRLLAKNPRERLGHADDVAAALGRLGAEDGPGTGSSEGEAWPKARAYLYRPGFAGREEPLSELERLLGSLEKGPGTPVLVGGESGIGKTRLLLELARRAERLRILVLSGECAPVEAADEGAAARSGGALQPMLKTLQFIADRCREKGLECTERLLGRRGKVLALYEPALRSLPGQERYPEPAELPAEAARMRLFSSLAETLSALSEEQPLLLVLDDLQWADELTLGFLGFLARTAFAGQERVARLLVLGTYRTEETGKALRAVLERSQTRQLRLGRLEEDAVGQMVCDMLALAETPRAFARYLSRQSEGNPFFVAEYLRSAVEEGLLCRDGEGHWRVAGPGQDEASEEIYEALPLPGALKALVGRRLEGLPAAARGVTEAAAVLGREVPILLLEPVAGLEEAELQEALGELLRRQVIEIVSPAGLRFVHDKIREVAYERLQGARRRALHLAAAEAMESRAWASVGELGEHWERAQRPEKAQPCYLEAARQATSRFAYGEAERLYRAYLALVSQPTLESIEARHELGDKILWIQGHASEAIDEHQKALEEARELGDLASEGKCLSSLGFLRAEIGQMREARILCEQALGIAREVGNRTDEASVLNSLGTIFREQGKSEESGTLYDLALSISRELGLRRGEGTVLVNLALLRANQGRLDEARALQERAVAIFQELGNRTNEGRALGNLAWVYKSAGDNDKAIALLTRAMAIHREIGNRRSEGIALGNLAIFYRYQGRVEEAWAHLQQARAIHSELGSLLSEGFVLREMATLQRQCHGAFDQAESLAQEAQAILEKAGHRLELVACLCERGHLALASHPPAREFLDQARSLTAALEARPEDRSGQNVSRLQRAQEAFEAGQHERLFRGELIDDLPEGLRRWLVQTGQLAPELAMLPASGTPGSEPSG